MENEVREVASYSYEFCMTAHDLLFSRQKIVRGQWTIDKQDNSCRYTHIRIYKVLEHSEFILCQSRPWNKSSIKSDVHICIYVQYDTSRIAINGITCNSWVVSWLLSLLSIFLPFFKILLSLVLYPVLCYNYFFSITSIWLTECLLTASSFSDCHDLRLQEYERKSQDDIR